MTITYDNQTKEEIKNCLKIFAQLGPPTARPYLKRLLNDCIVNCDLLDFWEPLKNAITKCNARYLFESVVNQNTNHLITAKYTFYEPRIDECRVDPLFIELLQNIDLETIISLTLNGVKSYSESLPSTFSQSQKEKVSWFFSDILGASLKNIDDPKEIESIINNKEYSFTVRWNLFWALSKIQANGRYLLSLKWNYDEYIENFPNLKNVSKEMQKGFLQEYKAWVCFGLGQMIKMYQFMDSFVMDWVIGSVEDIDAQTLLVDCLKDDSVKIRANAAWSLGIYPSERLPGPSLMAILETAYNKEDNPLVKTVLMESLKASRAQWIIREMLAQRYENLVDTRYTFFKEVRQTVEKEISQSIFEIYAEKMVGPSNWATIKNYIEGGLKKDHPNVLWFMSELAGTFWKTLIEQVGPAPEIVARLENIMLNPEILNATRWNCFWALSRLCSDSESDYRDAITFPLEKYLEKFYPGYSDKTEKKYEEYIKFLRFSMEGLSQMMQFPQHISWAAGSSKEDRSRLIGKFKEYALSTEIVKGDNENESIPLAYVAIQSLGYMYILEKDQNILKILDEIRNKWFNKLQNQRNRWKYSMEDIDIWIMTAEMRIQTSRITFIHQCDQLMGEKDSWKDILNQLDEIEQQYPKLTTYENKEPLYSARVAIKAFTAI